MIRMADIETDKDDRPEDPPKIFKTEVYKLIFCASCDNLKKASSKYIVKKS